MHAVRARPLQNVKNNIEPDEHREEADTFPTRGVNPETRLAPGLRPTLYPSVGLRCVASLRRSGLMFVMIHMQALLCHGVGLSPKTERACLCYFAPQGGLCSTKCEIQNTKYAKPLRRGEPKYIVPASERPPNLIAPAWGRNSIGRWSSVHAVRARPLLAIKNNIEPDEQCEEADTIPTRGVNPESRLAPGLRPALYPSVGLRSVAPGSCLL